MLHKPFFWVFMCGTFLFFSWFDSGNPTLVMHYENLLWFCLAVCAVLIKLNQIAQRFENAQRLQNIAAKTLRPKKDI